MTRPNLFSFATSELSQDAFLCWLASWADAGCKEEAPALHQLAQRFLTRLVVASTEGTTMPAVDVPAFDKVVARRQVDNIDVAIEIGKKLVLVIEDKTDTSDHSNQLNRYKKVAEEEWPGRELAFVYLKTGNQSSFKSVKDKGWGTVSRSDLLDILLTEKDTIANPIFQDFLDHLVRLEGETQAYRQIKGPYIRGKDVAWGGWEGRAWQGFFMALEARLGNGDWAYIPNATGGFMGFWWCFSSVENESCSVKLYLQLAGPQLTVKLHVPDKGRRRALRDKWWRILDESPTFKEVGLGRPNRLGLGQYMTVASKDEYRAWGPDGLLDLDATIEGLVEAAKIKTHLVSTLHGSGSSVE